MHLSWIEKKELKCDTLYCVLQVTYGQRYSKGTGLVDGEGMERLWSYLRRFLWTKEMTLPNRQDLLTSALLHYSRRNFDSLGNIYFIDKRFLLIKQRAMHFS